MAVWELTTEWKKSSIERQFWYNGDKVIIREEGYRWGTFTVESDERPLTDEELKNEDGYELGGIDNGNSWELVDLSDGCWSEIEKGRNCTDEDLAAFEAAWEESWYEGVEGLGWSQDDCEFYFTSGPLRLTNKDTGVEFSGSIDPATIVHTIELPLEEPIEEPELTDWFPVSTKPVRVGVYEILTQESINWPFPDKSMWDGKKWDSLDHTVTAWRGLANEPK